LYVFALHLKHFRSFEDLWIFPREDVNVLVGPNNCGKTTIFHALALLLDPAMSRRQPDVISRFDFHAMKLEDPIELRVWLRPRIKEVKDENGQVQLLFDEGEEVKAAFFDKLSEWQLGTEVRVDHCGVEERHPVELIPLTIEPMDTPHDVSGHERLLAVQLIATWNSQQEAADVEVNIVDQMGVAQDIFGARQRELIGFKLLGTRRNPLYELSLARRSVFSQMLDEGEILYALRQLQVEIDRSKQPLLAQNSIKSLMARLSRLVAPELMGSLVSNLGTDFTLTFLGGDLWRLRGATSIATRVGTGEMFLPLDYQGDGAQNLLLLFHLIELLGEKDSNSIVALEEPEQNLEPALARWVFGELCSLSHRPDEGTRPRHGQIFVTTHSPALVNELRGTESLIIFAEKDKSGQESDRASQWYTIAAHYLSPDCRKKLDQRRESYVSTLFARQVLIVEGDSEIGFLPVAFRYFAQGEPRENPYHLGLEVMKGGGRDNCRKHAVMLRSYGRKCHLLLDHDVDQDNPQELKSRFDGKADFVTCWPHESLLDFTDGCDLEVILAAYVPPEILFEAIKCVYDDPGHPLKPDKWNQACSKIKDEGLRDLFPQVCGDFDLRKCGLQTLGTERNQRAFLFALLHGPHDCKAITDMRMIAEFLVKRNAFPQIVDNLRERVLQSMIKPQAINHDEPYLASGK